MAAFGFLYGIHGQQPQRVDGQLVECLIRNTGSHFCPLSIRWEVRSFMQISGFGVSTPHQHCIEASATVAASAGRSVRLSWFTRNSGALHPRYIGLKTPVPILCSTFAHPVAVLMHLLKYDLYGGN
jgi:hypothetical protein